MNTNSPQQIEKVGSEKKIPFKLKPMQKKILKDLDIKHYSIRIK